MTNWQCPWPSNYPPFLFPRRLALVLLCSFGVAISYADRSNIAIVIIPMSEECGWDAAMEGIILASFFYGYITTQILGGYLADRFGGKSILAVGGLLWSFFTTVTPLAARSRLWLMIVCRILLGAGEGVGFPAIHSLLARWIPMTERSRAVSTVTAFSYLGAVLALLLSSPIAASSAFGWPWIFYVFGTLGLAWLFPWLLCAANVPERDKRITPQELEYIETNLGGLLRSPGSSKDSNIGVSRSTSRIRFFDGLGDQQVPIEPFSAVDESAVSSISLTTIIENAQRQKEIPWGRILRQPFFWTILLNQYCNNWGFYVLLQWLPNYYKQQFDVDLNALGYFSILPYTVQCLVGLASGFVADYLIKEYSVRVLTIRQWSQSIAMLGAATFLLLAGFCAKSAVAGMVYITIGLGLNAISLVGVSMAHLDFAPRYSGLLFGLSNTAATLPGIIGVLVTGLLLQWTHRWSLVFLVAAGHYVVGTIVWLRYVTAEIQID